jgi:mannosylglycerate hydrolase
MAGEVGKTDIVPEDSHGQDAEAALGVAVLVAHTHWDREWYLSLEQSRPRLVRLFENLRAVTGEPGYHSFWLDGQTVVIQDYWDTLGERPGWLDDALRDKNILIGPWYTLVDEWLTGGEAIIRNLLEGRRAMEAYGQDNRIGYLPDSFGHISQMPAILAGFGIDSAFVMRGLQDDELPFVEFNWISAGGQGVRGIFLMAGYFNAQRIDAELHLSGEQLDRLVGSVRSLEGRSATGVLLLMNGVDQALPTHRLSRSIEILGSLLPELHIEQGSLGDYLALVAGRLPNSDDIPVIRGEMLHAPQLDGTLSARVEQKVANRRVENWLTFYVEPLLALVQPDRRHRYWGMLRRAWALVMQCHAHDSICSCHSDLVAADVMHRLSGAQQLAEKLEEGLWVELLQIRPNEQSAQLPSTLVLRNPLPWMWNSPVEVTVDIPAGTDIQCLVFEQDGAPVPAHIITRRKICRWTEHHFGKVQNKEVDTQRLTALIKPCLDGGSVANVLVRLGQHAETQQEGLCREPNTLDNGIIRVVVHPDGRLDITDLATATQIGGLNQIVDEVDQGDLYEHARSLSGQVQSPYHGTLNVVENSNLRAAIQVDTQIECNDVLCPLQLCIALNANSRWVSVEAILDNRSRDHWLRMTCPAPGGIRDLWAHTPFDLVRRSPENGAPYVDGDRLRFARRLGQPMQWGLFAQVDHGLLGIVNRGLYEYLYEDEAEISISLMRFVGLIRPDLTSYSAAGANRAGVQRVEYALGLWPPDHMAEAVQAMIEYNLPPRSFQVFGPPPFLPMVGVRWSNPHWMPSALKPTEAGGGSVLRFWNASNIEQEGVVEYSASLGKAMVARLDETPLEPLPARLTVRPKEIVTILFRP